MSTNAVRQRSTDRVIPLASRQVDDEAIARNFRRVEAIARTPIMAVIKADAFGHGALPVARTVLAAGAARLGVATIDEAIELRVGGVVEPVLAWLIDERSAVDEAVDADVTLSCADRGTLDAVARGALRTRKRAAVHLELDTGMSRGGAHPDEWDRLCSAAADLSRAGVLRVEGLWSHLAGAADPRPEAVAHQTAAFTAGVRVAGAHGIRPPLLHLANSAGALAHPSTRFSMVRIGAALFGIETVDGREHGLESALRVTTRIVQLRSVAAGVSIGYRGAHRTDRATTLALLPVGYGDGVPRALSPGGEVVIVGRRHPIVGAISMDQLMVDVGAAPVSVGDESILLGSRTAGEPDALEWAKLTDTVPHEILTGFGRRVVVSRAGVRG